MKDTFLAEITPPEEIIKTSVSEYLTNNRWHSRSCTNCGDTFFSKIRMGNPGAEKCGSHRCNGYEFLTWPRKKELSTPVDLVNAGQEFFAQFGYTETEPVPIKTHRGKTLFTGTAGQVFDGAIFGESDYQTNPLFVAQPVVRLHGVSLVGEVEGFSTSFVNIATEQMNSTIEQHVEHLDNWLTFFSSIGVYVGDMTLKTMSDSPDWGKGEFKDSVIKIYYGGLEIGVANYFIGIPQQNRQALTMSDFSFGLERLTWALSKTRSYFDVIGPIMPSIQNRQKEMDAYRTMVLLVASGVIPGHQDRGSKLRMLAKSVSRAGDDYPTGMATYYDRWWRNFINLPVDSQMVQRIITGERNRNINLAFQEKLGRNDENAALHQDPSLFLLDLVKKKVVSPDELRSLVSGLL